MKINKKSFFLIFWVLITFLYTDIVKADIIWPSGFIAHKMLNLYIIISGFVTKALFIKFCAKEKLIKALYISAIMNGVSAIIGGALIFFDEIIIDFIYRLLKLLSFNPYSSDIFHWIISYILAVCINVLIDGYIIDIIFWIDFKKSLWWLILSNFIIAALIAFLI